MKHVFSTLVIATSFALLVPDNRAQAVRAAELMPIPAAVQSLPAVSGESASAAQGTTEVPGEMSWVLALGFLAAVVARRLRPD